MFPHLLAASAQNSDVLGQIIQELTKIDAFSLAVLGLIGLTLLLLAIDSLKLWGTIKRLILAVILCSALVFTGFQFMRVSAAGWEQAGIVQVGILVLSAIVGFFALAVSVSSFFSHSRKTEEQLRSEPHVQDMLWQTQNMFARAPEPALIPISAPPKRGAPIERKEAPAPAPEYPGEKNLKSVLSYMIIAEFGIFASPTKPAPSQEVGLIMSACFCVAVLVFLKTAYHDYFKGIKHFFAALAFGFILSVLLGIFWDQNSLANLLSMGYFSSVSLVALMTGVAVSLLMGSKG